MAPSVVAFIFSLQNHLKLYHWTTTLFSRHKAMDELLNDFAEQSDRFVENYIGRYGRNAQFLGGGGGGGGAATFGIRITPLNDKTVAGFLKASILFFTREVPKYLKVEEDVDLFSIRDEIVAALNKARYLCTLH